MLLTNDLYSRNETIVNLVNNMKGMLFNFARAYQLDFDDVLQDAAIIALEVWPRIPVDCANVGAYLNRCIRGELYRRLSRDHKEHTASIDAPVSADSDTTFADMLADFTQHEAKQREQREDDVAEAIHAALKQCRLQEQRYCRARYGLNSFNPVPGPLPDIVNSRGRDDRSNMSLRNSVMRRFRRDPQLLALMS